MTKAVIFDMFETLITHYETPLYFGKQMAESAGVSEDKFREIWRATDTERTIGKMTFEDVIRQILLVNDKYSDALFSKIVSQRKQTKRDCFLHLHQNMIPLLEELKARNIKIGLITNCFSEEAEVISESILFPYFDATCMSCVEGVKKPNPIIFTSCMDRLMVHADECLYVGDGGSFELETARSLGMKTLQALWYRKEGTLQNLEPKDDFLQAEDPLEILQFL